MGTILYSSSWFLKATRITEPQQNLESASSENHSHATGSSDKKTADSL